MARRRRKRKQDTLSIMGKVIVLILAVIAGYFMYKNYGDEVIDKVKTTNTKEETEKESTKEETKKEESTTKEEDNKKEEGKKKYTYEDQEGEKVTIKADKSVEATGFAGASNHKFFLRGTTLYYKNISSGEDEVILAYNVEDLYIENKEVTALLSKDGKIVVENNYITYKNK